MNLLIHDSTSIPFMPHKCMATLLRIAVQQYMDDNYGITKIANKTLHC